MAKISPIVPKSIYVLAMVFSYPTKLWISWYPWTKSSKYKKLSGVCSDVIILVYIIDSIQARGLTNYTKMAMTREYDVSDESPCSSSALSPCSAVCKNTRVVLSLCEMAVNAWSELLHAIFWWQGPMNRWRGNFSRHSGACATHIFTYLVRGPCLVTKWELGYQKTRNRR